MIICLRLLFVYITNLLRLHVTEMLQALLFHRRKYFLYMWWASTIMTLQTYMTRHVMIWQVCVICDSYKNQQFDIKKNTIFPCNSMERQKCFHNLLCFMVRLLTCTYYLRFFLVLILVLSKFIVINNFIHKLSFICLFAMMRFQVILDGQKVLWIVVQ